MNRAWKIRIESLVHWLSLPAGWSRVVMEFTSPHPPLRDVVHYPVQKHTHSSRVCPLSFALFLPHLLWIVTVLRAPDPLDTLASTRELITLPQTSVSTPPPTVVASHLDRPVIQREWSLKAPLLMNRLAFLSVCSIKQIQSCLAEITTETAVENFGFNLPSHLFPGSGFLFDLLVFVPSSEVEFMIHISDCGIFQSSDGLFRLISGNKNLYIKTFSLATFGWFVPVPRWNKGEPPFIKVNRLWAFYANLWYL